MDNDYKNCLKKTHPFEVLVFFMSILKTFKVLNYFDGLLHCIFINAKLRTE